MSKDDIELWTLIVAVITGLIAVIGLVYANWTLRDTNKIAKAQFYAVVRGLMSHYDGVHTKLRPGGGWYARGPQNVEEWAQVELYIGLFEYCERLLDKQLLDRTDFEHNLLYRLENILHNRSVVEAKLRPPRAENWNDFIKLCKRYKLHSLIEPAAPQTAASPAVGGKD